MPHQEKQNEALIGGSGLNAGLERGLTTEKNMKDERYKKIMDDLGMPNSQSLLVALQQVANEAGQECAAAEREACAAIADARAMRCEAKTADADGDDEVTNLRSLAWQFSVLAAEMRNRSNND